MGLEPHLILHGDRRAAANKGELLPKGACLSISAGSALETDMTPLPYRERGYHDQ